VRLFSVLVVGAILAAATSVAGCAAEPTTTSETEAVPDGDTRVRSLESAISDVFESNLETATVRYAEHGGGSSWDVIIALDPAPTDRSIDMYAAEILAAAASVDDSSTPIYLTISSERFKPTWSEMQWGCFAYYWTHDLGSSESRSDTVYLFHGEAEPPGGPVHGCMLTSRERGSWGDVSIGSLRDWARTGAPVVWGLPERDD